MSTSLLRASHSISSKTRKLQGACDNCKRKKSDSADVNEKTCTNCLKFDAECTHDVAKRKKKSHIRSITFKPPPSPHQGECSRSDRHILPKECDVESQASIHPLVYAILSSHPSLDLTVKRSLITVSQHINRLERELLIIKQSAGETRSIDNTNAELQVISDNSIDSRTTTDGDDDLSDLLKRLSVTSSQKRHFGPSSNMSLVETALKIRQESERGLFLNTAITGIRRPDFWTVHPWEVEQHGELPIYDFPEQDLLHELINIFFDQVNIHFTLLHRPTFQRSVEQNLHITNPQFGATVLALCAVASRYSDDSRVLLEGDNSRYSSGWKWFRQIQLFRKSFSSAPSLYELQTNCLSTLYLHGTSQPEACWITVGMGIRYAQDVGAYRKKVGRVHSIEDELWKRAFWILVCVDTILSTFLGRPRATTSDDYDLDLPIDCDDEYWENEDQNLAFVQPPDKPSSVASFIAYLKLITIVEHVQCTLYPLKKSGKTLLDQKDLQVVVDLDSELNQWIELLPSHLRWTSCKQGDIFFEQSAFLHAAYHHTRILVHKSFISPSIKSPSLPFPSLVICVNAARSCANVIRLHSQKRYLPFPQIQFAVFASAIVLLLNHWSSSKGHGSSKNTKHDVQYIQDCLEILHKHEARWFTTGRLCDVIRGLALYGGVHLVFPPVQPVQERKREEGSDNIFPTYLQSTDGEVFHEEVASASQQLSWDTGSWLTSQQIENPSTDISSGLLDSFPPESSDALGSYNLFQGGVLPMEWPSLGMELLESTYQPPYDEALNPDASNLAIAWLNAPIYTTGWSWDSGVNE